MSNKDRRGSRARPFERSSSYSAAIGNSISSIELPNIGNTEVYTNEELKKRYRISQNYVEGKEIIFPYNDNDDTNEFDEVFSYQTQYSSDGSVDGAGLVMKIDVECTTETSSPSTVYKQLSSNSTQPLVSNAQDDLDNIEVEPIYSSVQETATNAHGYSTPYSRRRKEQTRRRHQVGRPIRSRRVILKNGEDNVPVRSNIPSKSMKYMRDIVNTIINSKWRFIILLMIVSHFFFWFLFAGIWYAVTLSYQDDIGDEKEHCITGTSSFAGLLMMAVETQMTIGYGVRYPNEECPEAIVIMVLEIVAGTAISGALASLLFLKLIRPNRHLYYVGFSKKATVCMRDGHLCLMFRVWDLLNFHIINGHVTAYMLKPIRTLEGEFVQNYIHQLKLKEANSFLIWPITVVHVIDDSSPLYDFSAQDMMDYRFEIVVCLTGSSKNMGTVTQSRTSYLSKEIIWGHRFKNVLNYCKNEESYDIDIDNLNTTEQVDTPLCSASQLKEFENMSFVPEDSSTLSMAADSFPSAFSTPNVSRSNTQRSQKSYGWNYRKFPERDEDISKL